MTPVRKIEQIVALLQAPVDEDYVENFQALARVNVDIEKNGADPARLLRKAILTCRLGDYVTTVECAARAGRMDPTRTEAHYYAAIGHLFLALSRVGGAEVGPNMRPTTDRDVVPSLQAAHRALVMYCERVDSDRDARRALLALGELVDLTDDEQEMRRVLARH